MNTRFVILLFLFLKLCITAQNDNVHESLIVIHYNEADKANVLQDIYTYDFVNGVYAGRQVLLSVKGQKDGKDYIRMDNENNTLYNNRYLISQSGNIIDLRERKILFDGNGGRLIKCTNDSIIFYVNDIFKGKYYAYYDLSKQLYSSISSLTFKLIPGQDIEFDKRQEPYKLYLYPVNKPKVVLLDDAGYSSAPGRKEPVVFWLDNSSFLFNYTNKGAADAVLMKYSIDSKSKQVIGSFTNTGETQPGIYGANDGVVLETNDNYYRVDLKTPALVACKQIQYPFDFAIDAQVKPNGRAISYKNQAIGTFHFNKKTFRTSERYAAFVKELQVGKELYQQGIAVWSKTKQQWLNIDAEEITAFVGWIKQ
ncbi:MAG: hypothetical protein JST26_02275 [Bacteroidetes bacterium]|nr:hypothetical protein [Bacteroidota bacterium]